MSYEIFKKIKQLPDGSFEVTSASSNVYPKDYHTWHMTWFNEHFPEFTNDEKRAAWLLMSIGNADKFYPNNWKADQDIVREFAHTKNMTPSDIWHVAHEDYTKFCIYVKAFLDFKKAYKQCGEAYRVQIKSYGTYHYVGKVTSGTRRTRVRFAYDPSNAKVFKGPLTKVMEIFEPFKGDWQPMYERV